MKPFRWFIYNLNYFSLAFVLLLVSTVFALGGSGYSIFDASSNSDQDWQPVEVATEQTAVKSNNTDQGNFTDIIPQQDYYIDAGGNWIAGTPPPTEVVPKTSSWCGEKKRKKFLDYRCEEIRCPDIRMGPRGEWFNSCDPCEERFNQLVCLHTDNRYNL